MKKINFTKTIAALLVLSMITTSAALFTGCGKKEAPAVSGAQSSGTANESSQQATEDRTTTVNLKNFRDKIVNEKLYTVGYDPDSESVLSLPQFYIKADSPVESDGFTFTRASDDISKDRHYTSSWEITKDGEKYANCIFDSSCMNGQNKFNIGVEIDPTSMSAKHSSDKYEKAPNDQFDIELPPIISADECKKRVDDIQKLYDARVKKSEYADLDLQLDSIYYYKGKPNETCVRALYYFAPYKDAPDYKNYVYLEGTYPFLYENAVQVAKWDQKKLRDDPGNYDNWIKIK